MNRFVIVLVVGLSSTAVVGPLAGTASSSAASPRSDWTVYHGDRAGTGVAPGITSVNTSSAAWTSPALDGQIYGEPLVFSGRVFVATENDVVYALSAADGAVLWSTRVANPVPSHYLPCGDIDPYLGITGTPVIDPSRKELFVVADEYVNDNPSHVLVGIDTASGTVEMHENVDPSGADPSALLQRTGLNLDNGRIVFGMGGNDGDCASYRGRVVAVAETGGTPQFFTVDAGSGESQGAVWMGGAAPAVSSTGDIWVSTGNGSVHSSGGEYDDSDAALELSPSLRLEQFFAPSNWPENNAADLDMSVVPALLSDGDVLLAGKSRIVYLLSGTKVGGIGGQLASIGPACDEDIDGGSAVYGDVVFLPCLSGIVAVQVSSSPPALKLLWSSGTGGGPPIVAAGLVWTIGDSGVLYGLNPVTGTVRQQVAIGSVANHFPTPSIGNGLLLAPTADHVVAFRASVASPPAATTTTQPKTTTTTNTDTKTSSSSVLPTTPGSSSKGGSLPQIFGSVAVLALVAALVTTFVKRRRPRRVD
jgi:outer membrane protein assembly factor BamB